MTQALAIRYGVIVIALAIAVWGVYRFGHDRGVDAMRAHYEPILAEYARKQAAGEAAARQTETARVEAIGAIATDAQNRIETANRDAAAAHNLAVSLRQRADALARRCAPGNPSAPAPSPASPSPGDLLADVLGRADAASGELAAYADRARAAGSACEQAYDALR